MAHITSHNAPLTMFGGNIISLYIYVRSCSEREAVEN
jgi:hypothetical protein